MYKYSITRIIILVALVSAGMFLIFCQETITEEASFIIHTVLDKCLGILCMLAAGLLYCRWKDSDPILRKHERWCREADEARLD